MHEGTVCFGQVSQFSVWCRSKKIVYVSYDW